jgi:hypothetical protein
MPEELDDLVQAWWEYRRRSKGTREERKALELREPKDLCERMSLVDDILYDGGARSVQLITALAESAYDEDGLATIGAGPLEDLIDTHGPDILDLLVSAAQTSPSFRRALQSAALHGVHGEVAQRLRRLQAEI